MENPFEVITTRISRLENMIVRLTSIIEGARPANAQEAPSHDRRTPATRKLAAEYLGVSVGTVDNLVKSNQLKPTRVGRTVRFRWEELDRFIAKRNN